MSATNPIAPDQHPFVRAPHRTLVALSFPVLLSMIAEPLTGLVDTAFVARLGTSQLAALGVATAALSSIFWVFNFLQIGTQTQVAQTAGRNEHHAAAQINGLALVLAGALGVLLIGVGLLTIPVITSALGAADTVQTQAVRYMQIRVFGAPAVLLTLTAFGALRGLQDMRTPLAVAVTINVLNVLFDWLLVFGVGPFPALGIAGAALATTISQWLGAVWVVAVVLQQLGLPSRIRFGVAGALLRVGGDLFIRTGLLMVFLLLATRTATRIGTDAGAAHQAVRQVWVFTALFLDAFAVTGQSLIGYFVGAGWMAQARQVAATICLWSFGTGVMLGAVMLLSQGAVMQLLVPPEAYGLFVPAWIVAALIQPLNALAFATDGVHWGTGDYRFLRNAMLVATVVSVAALLLLNEGVPGALTWIWVITGLWSTVRAGFGLARIWPGIGKSPFAATTPA